MNKLLIPIITTVVIVVGIGAFFSFKQPPNKLLGGKCGDGICDSLEKSNPNLCPIDCKNKISPQILPSTPSTTTPPHSTTPPSTTTPPVNTTPATPSTPTAPTPKSSSKDSPFGIFGSYVTLTAENPLTSVSKSDVNILLKDLGVKWEQEMPTGDNISEISKSGVNVYSRIGCMGQTPPYFSEQRCKDKISSLIKQYKDTIKYWEIATEPNGGSPPMGWKGYGKEYATDLKEAYTIIKKECPDCYVVFGGLTGVGVGATEIPKGAADFLKDALAGGAGNYFDAFEFKQHSANAGDYKEIITKLNIYSKIFSDNGLNINNKLIFIETATHDGSPDPKYNSPGLKSQTQTQQATGLLKYYIYSISHGIDKIFWNLVYERHNFGSTGAALPGAPSVPAGSSVFDYYGLVNNPDNDGDSSKKLAYYSYKKMVEILDGADWSSIQAIQEKDGVYVYKFTRQGKPIWVAWNDNSAEKQATISGINSNQVKITEAIPKYTSGKDVTDYATSFNTEIKSVIGGKITTILKDKPVFAEEK